jgi:hypothetical protein
MIPRPSVTALTECRTLLDTVATKPARVNLRCPDDSRFQLALDLLIDFFLRIQVRGKVTSSTAPARASTAPESTGTHPTLSDASWPPSRNRSR